VNGLWRAEIKDVLISVRCLLFHSYFTYATACHP